MPFPRKTFLFLLAEMPSERGYTRRLGFLIRRAWWYFTASIDWVLTSLG